MQKLLLTAICIIASLQLPAQDISTNDVNETDWVIEEEVVTEPDGFKWIRIDQKERGDKIAKYHGAKDMNGKVIIPLSRGYEGLWYEAPGWFFVETVYGEIRGACDLTGREIIKCMYHYVTYGLRQLLITKEIGDVLKSYSDRYHPSGFFWDKETGQFVEKLDEEHLKTEKDGFKWTELVHLQGKSGECKELVYGARDAEGNIIISPERGYSEVYYWGEAGYTYFEVKHNGGMGICDKSGKEIVECRHSNLRYDKKKGFMAFTENKKWQLLGVFLDKNGLGYTK